MRSRIGWSAAVALACGLTPAAWGQAEVIPAGATATAAAAPGATATATAAAPARNLWTFLCPTQEMKDRCKEKFCDSMFGKLINNSLKIPSTFTGGVIPMCCPPVRKSDLLKPADSAEGAAARIKEDEANAKARRAAVRYLGTVDCRYWPEARDALINSLRADRNECVRLEAAWSLGRGCCCSKETMQALILTVTGSDADDNPQEPSERVRVAAEFALRRCLDCYVEVERVKEKKPAPLPPPTREDEEVIPEEIEKKKGSEKISYNPGAAPLAGTSPYYQRVSLLSRDRILADARKALESRPQVSSVPPPGSELEGRSLAAIWSHAVAQGSLRTASTPPPPQAASVEPRSSVVMTHPAEGSKSRGLWGRKVEKAAVQNTPTTPTTTQRVVISETEVVTAGPALPPPPAAPRPAATRPAPVVLSQPPAAFVPPALPAPSKPETSRPLTKAVETSTPARTPLAVPTTAATSKPLSQPATTVPQPVVPVTSKAPAAAKPPVLQLVDPPVKKESAPVKLAVPEPVLPPPMPAPVKLTLPEPVLPPPMPAPKVSQAAPVTPATPKTQTSPVASKPAAPPAPLSSAVTTASTAAPAHQPQWKDVVRPSAPLLSKEELLGMFRSSVEPTRREWAAEQLGRVPGAGADDRVVQTLLAGANSDPAPLVRVACLNSIHKLGIMDYQLVGILQRLKADSDVRVKQTAQAIDRWLQDEAGRCVVRPATKVR